MAIPDTRHSLLLRLRNPSDGEAWALFEHLYRPAIVRVARLKGMQDADAQDLAQQVLLSVSQAIHRFQPDSQQARFRTWLRRVTVNAAINALTRGRRWEAAGDEALQVLLQQQPASSGPDSQLLLFEYRREVFSWVVAQVKPEFTNATWDAFWLTAVEDHDVDSVALRLGKTRGSVYAARSRVMQRIRERIEELDG